MKKAIWIAVAVICIAVCVVSGTFLVRYYLGLKRAQQLMEAAKTQTVEAPPDSKPVDPEPADPEPGEEPAEPEPVEIPIDFDALQEINPEIYAWITVPGTSVDHPILQSETDDLFYNSHGSDGKPFMLGAVFSQKTYNTMTFSDPMTLLYGHSTVIGQPGTFADLNSFADPAYFEAHRRMIVYTRDNMYVYQIYAACNHNNEHILYYYDFSNEEEFNLFFENFFDATKDCDHVDPDAMPVFGDQLLTLSTCYAPNMSERYLIYGVLTDVFPALKE